MNHGGVFMAKKRDWMPRTKNGRLVMAKDWLFILKTKATDWGIPASAITVLETKSVAAETWLAKYTSPDRTRTITAETNRVFADLVAFMRDFKRRYFLLPPLTTSDLVSLKLKPADETSTEEGVPSAQPEADLIFPGIHLVQLVRIRPVGGRRPGDGSECGVRVHYGLTGAPTTKHPFRLEEIPQTGWGLPYSVWASRKKMWFDFEGESGNQVYFSLQYERGTGKEGPFGPILKAVIP
jgi:hypothetical protein